MNQETRKPRSNGHQRLCAGSTEVSTETGALPGEVEAQGGTVTRPVPGLGGALLNHTPTPHSPHQYFLNSVTVNFHCVMLEVFVFISFLHFPHSTNIGGNHLLSANMCISSFAHVVFISPGQQALEVFMGPVPGSCSSPL